MKVEIVVDSRIRLPVEGLPEDCLRRLTSSFEHDNPHRESLRRMGVPFWNEPRTYLTWARLMAKGARPPEVVEGLSFPRGGMGRVREALREFGVDWEVKDRRSRGTIKGSIPDHQREPRAHQREAVQACVARHQGIVRAPTGSGKTSMGFMLAAAINLPTLVVVDSGGLFRQWVERAAEELGLHESEIGIIQGAKRRLKPLTIAMGQTLAKKGVDAKLARAFGLVICDEVQIAAARTFFSAIDPFEAKYRVGISASEKRKDKKEFLISDVFGDVIHESDRDELEDRGVIVDVEVRVVPTAFRADWYGLSTGEGDAREVDFDRLLKEMAADEAREALGLRLVAGEAGAGKQVLAMAHQVEHCTRIAAGSTARGYPAGYLIGGAAYKLEFERTASGMRDGTCQVGVGTLAAVGKGIDLPSVSRSVMFTPIAGNKQAFGQARGRVGRSAAGKADARMYVLWDRDCSFGPQHLRNMLAWNRRVVVLEGGEWVDGREYSRRHFGRTRAA